MRLTGIVPAIDSLYADFESGNPNASSNSRKARSAATHRDDLAFSSFGSWINGSAFIDSALVRGPMRYMSVHRAIRRSWISIASLLLWFVVRQLFDRLDRAVDVLANGL